MSLQTCPACGRNNFTVTGLSQHLAKSRDSRFNKTTKNIAPESGHPKGNYSDDTPKVHNSTYFGYFETEGSILRSQGEDSDSDDHHHPGEDLDEPFFEPEWEVPVPSLPEDGTFDDTNLPEDGTFDNTHQDIEAHARGQHGCVVVPYPDPCAGQRTSRHSPDQSANVMYGAQLVDDENNTNIYYPFASKIEWEIARWAKLRGSSSTASTDLLSIDGQMLGTFIQKREQVEQVDRP
ncbi:hypothetical protein BDR07DRAFT_1477297 [Suillus spraguei]|nr:hypothetical protein BDR07DRAFT_1477297 [Suillus spraguei]